MEFSHIPVLLSQCLDGLAIDPAGIYLDGTAGGAGHSKEIAKRLTTGRLISLDQDPDAVATAAARLKGLPAQVVQANFRETARVLDELEIPFINGALLDLGVSSHQLDRCRAWLLLSRGCPAGYAHEPAGAHCGRLGEHPGP